MKQTLVVLLVLAALGVLLRSGGFLPGMGRDPAMIANPVYAAVRFRTAIHDRTFEMVELAKTFDQDDCNRIAANIIERMQRHHGDGLAWELESFHCTTGLDARSERLFENKPTFVNYVSATPGSSSERDLRMIIWGVTAEEGDVICSVIPRVQERWNGAVSCIHALPGQ